MYALFNVRPYPLLNFINNYTVHLFVKKLHKEFFFILVISTAKFLSLNFAVPCYMFMKIKKKDWNEK